MGRALDDILGAAFALLFGVYRQRSLLETIDEISSMSHRCSNCDQAGAKGPKSPAEKKK